MKVRQSARAVLVCVAGLVLFAGGAVPVEATLPPAPREAFRSAEGCGCHAELVNQWRQSMHAQSVTDPLYQYKLRKGNEQTDGAIGAFCETCHSPAAAMFGELGQEQYSPVAMEGITCTVCHQVTGYTKPVGNTSLVWTPDGVMRGPHADAFSPAHATAESDTLDSASFCGSCHDVRHPVNGLLLEGTYTEWRNSPYAEEGVRCQDCHMNPGPGMTGPNPGRSAAGAPYRDHIYAMTFVGANVALGNAELAEDMLRRAATVDMTVSEIAEPGETVPVTVRITNVGAGHYLPTGLTDMRRMWLEVVATGPDGVPVEIGRREFHTVFHDAEGEAPAEIWFATGVYSDDRIRPRETVENTWETTMSAGPLTLSATLYYRSATEEVAEAAGIVIPTTTMTQTVTTVFTSAAEAAEAARGASVEEGIVVDVWMIALAIAGVVVAAIGGLLFVRRRAH